MTINIDPVTLTISVAILGWVFRVDRKITKIETLLHSCKFCRSSLEATESNSKIMGKK
jgi:hypothetical protein